MFTFVGFFDFVLDAWMFIFLWPVELFLLIGRLISGDYNWAQSYMNDPVDMNRLVPDLFPADPYDERYWTNLSNGVDCNGNIGFGLYCFCPS